MLHEQRKSRRKLLSVPAWIDCGNHAPLLRCRIEDVSDGGARLNLGEHGHQVPYKFVLLLSRSASTGRMCVLRWRRGATVGVEYLKRGVCLDSAQHAGTNGSDRYYFKDCQKT